ncbi:permease-like cell division protein FtsX [Ectothiorhodospira sp. BSL-9]|uniref:permease-like cell division protein FtsX n=1 Tax=Ectothiorhodospira sp. BSL-9 TaxID=1442136 RepID=UPI0007B43769|nr:permease-like cell division protein FtsX [Ectothiorhodospira sp. BSL-9]ANB01419.1 cell division protein [Ectothiorhodospira sp. BSL-9]TVQ69769.1 MAG: cell division protein FtsX [Chromatiaceae bacterium]
MRSRRRLSRPTMHARFQAYGINHLRALVFSLGKLYRAPFSSLLTLMVIAIALTLPSILYLILANLQQVTPQWDRSAQISVFLESSVADEDVPALATRLAQRSDVAATEGITRDQALEEFRAHSGFGDAVDALGENPLPAVILITPALDTQSPANLEALVASLNELAEVDSASLDMQWVQRLYAIMETLERTTLILALLLGLGVILVVGNTIRLDIQSRREEIEVAKLVGATDAFIRRPFLYGGLWLGLGGALTALLIVAITRLLLTPPVQDLAALYGGQFGIRGLTAPDTLTLLATGAILGLAGSWVTVGRHLRDIEPS